MSEVDICVGFCIFSKYDVIQKWYVQINYIFCDLISEGLSDAFHGCYFGVVVYILSCSSVFSLVWSFVASVPSYSVAI